MNSYKYVGFVFSAKLSFDVATNGEHLTRAQRGTFEVIETSRKLGCSSPSLFFKPFDAQIVPCLLYGSELWGIKARDSIEKVHIQPCKLFFNVLPQPPNDMVYGELGRFPLYIHAAARCLQYWFRLRQQPLYRYSRKAYDMLSGLQERNSKAKNLGLPC